MNSKNLLAKIFILIFIFFFAGGSVSAQDETLKANTPMSSHINGYYEYLPQSYDANDPSKKFPVLIFFHGLGATGNGSTLDLQKIIDNLFGGVIWRLHYESAFPKSFTVNGVTSEFIVIGPQFTTEPYWGGFDWTMDIDDVIEYCKSNYHVDEDRIYLAGQSMGSGYIMDYVTKKSEYAKKVAAVLLASVNVKMTAAEGDIVSAAKLPFYFAVAKYDKSGFDALEYTMTNIDSIENAVPAPTVLPKLTVFDQADATHVTAGRLIYDPATTTDGINAYQWLLQFDRKEVVPVTGLELTVKTSAQSVSINWKTLSEYNSASFTVERSGNAKDFSDLGSVTAFNSARGGQYTFTDNSPLQGINYYRIRQSDKDGHSTYSTIVSIQINDLSVVRVFPNPVRNILTVEMNRSIQNVKSIRIYDNAGKLYRTFSVRGNEVENIDVSTFPKGFYSGQIVGNSKIINFSFVKK